MLLLWAPFWYGMVWLDFCTWSLAVLLAMFAGLLQLLCGASDRSIAARYNLPTMALPGKRVKQCTNHQWPNMFQCLDTCGVLSKLAPPQPHPVGFFDLKFGSLAGDVCWPSTTALWCFRSQHCSALQLTDHGLARKKSEAVHQPPVTKYIYIYLPNKTQAPSHCV